MSQITIATWNLQTDKPTSQWRADAFRRAMDEIRADVWVITEPLLTLSPGVDYRLVAHSCEAADIEKNTNPRWVADRRWVAIWSKLPARKIKVRSEPDRMACIRVEQDGRRDIVIVGTVLPWTADKKWPSEKGKGFCDALARQAAEWKKLLGNSQTAHFCVTGDFNQSLPYERYYGLRRSAEALRQVLESHGLVCLTGDKLDPMLKDAKRPSIDHICVSNGLQPLSASRTWKIPHRRYSSQGITDHNGAWAKLNVLQ